MLLETQDIRRNDILVYSQNQFDFESNFKIIFKHERIKKPRPISYFDVCELIKEPVPKSIILYRLLTNVTHMDAFSTKYGYFINIHGGMELVYFDPIFALKDLRHLKFDMNPDEFRFKIQQVGLTTGEVKDKEIEFIEVYSFDQRADEAKNQNDKVFADAIFAFDDTYSSNEETEDEFDRRVKQLLNKKTPEALQDENVNFEAAQQTPESPKISKPNLMGIESTTDVREQKVQLLKQAMGLDQANSQSGNFNSFLQKNAPEILPKKEIPQENLLDLFKSAGKGKSFDFERDSVILKLSKK